MEVNFFLSKGFVNKKNCFMYFIIQTIKLKFPCNIEYKCFSIIKTKGQKWKESKHNIKSSVEKIWTDSYVFLMSYKVNSVLVEFHVLFYGYREICERMRKNESIRESLYLSREPELHKKVNKRKRKKKKKRHNLLISLLNLLTSKSVCFIFLAADKKWLLKRK